MTTFGLFGPKKSIPPTSGKGGAKKTITPGKGAKPGKGGGGKKAIRLAVLAALALLALTGCDDQAGPTQTCTAAPTTPVGDAGWSYRCQVTR